MDARSNARREEGKMEGLTRKRLTVFMAWVVGALLLCSVTPKSASAQELVAPNGVGDLLIFPLWTTDDRDTLIAVTNMSGAGGQDGVNQYVHFRFREEAASTDILNFTIGLSPGDVWTAAISAGSLTVFNAGSADAAVGGLGFTPPPAVGTPVSISATTGYIEVYTMETAGGDDVIMGHAFFLNTDIGAGEGRVATALTGFNATSEAATIAADTSVSSALAREGGVDKEMLLSRYNIDPAIAGSTTLLLTFPTGLPLVGDPITVDVFDENENRNFSPRSITLTQEVNVIDLATSGANLQAASGALIEGWLRILNNTLGAESDSLNAIPVTRFPAIGLVFQTFENGAASFNNSFYWQWAAITGAGGFGGANSFNLASDFEPWTTGAGVPIVPSAANATDVGALSNFGGT
jgi:hypothetical protein